MSKKVVVPIAKGFEELEAVALIDMMRRGGLEVTVCTLINKDVEGANGIVVKADAHIDSINSDEIDMVVLPGGWDGTYRLAEDQYVQRLLKEMDAKGKDIGAMCAAPYALEQAGVLKEGYTCYPGAKDEIKTAGYTDASKVVQTDNIMTSQGPGTAICFGIAIVERLTTAENAQTIKEGVLAGYC
jgi:4-methyl-5(b-hydroxyethyl)-thiazole monophosphate biosynthesis